MARFAYYVVARGRRPSIYKSWAACSVQVNNFSNAVYAGAHILHEAQQFLRSHGIEEQNAAYSVQDNDPQPSQATEILEETLHPLLVEESNASVHSSTAMVDNILTAYQHEESDVQPISLEPNLPVPSHANLPMLSILIGLIVVLIILVLLVLLMLIFLAFRLG
ncbi:hypothetical protein QJS10_CPA08g00988 [Acorus calamus]|uniref:Ribonuclease H1 N-terminal domain-containing protein n=1 Tax=Acorus calamus TaxID=4465 RepID=A0AAV9EC37_ACOCL|nr:hypothetical protein QJS10_CPA08g00988 [Acorus calamus]